MRILLAANQTLMLNKGGPTYVILQMKKELAKLGYQVEYFDYWNDNLTLKKDDIVHLFLASLSTYSLAVNLHQYGANYVVTPIFYSKHSANLLKLYMLLEKLSKPVLKRSYSDYYFTKTVCDFAEFVLPNTKKEASLLVNGLSISPQKTFVVPNGVEKRFADSSDELWLKKFGYKDFILYVGHLGAERKNGVNIIKALSKIDEKAVIIANVLDTAEGKYCRELIEKSKNITLIEWLNHDDKLLESAYAACKAFILPTHYETPGIAAMEAALAGANIVITPFGGTKEYFKDYAIYANPFSVDDIIAKTEQALILPKNEKLKKHIMENYLWEKVAKRTVKFYEKIVKNG